MTMIAWEKLPRGTYRYSNDGLTADVWEVSGKGWLWSVYGPTNCPIQYDSIAGLLAAHEGIFQPTMDCACELALKVMQV